MASITDRSDECSPSLDSLPWPTAFDPAPCTRRGLCPVTKMRPQGSETLESHSLYYELHGKGTRHNVVFIMGLNSCSFAWGPQVEWFGRDGFEEEGWRVGKEKSGVGASILVFDNRGVGNSGYPKGPYTTSGMAEDLICLLDELGWTGKRELNVVGVSLGGMIAQEVAYRIPGRIQSHVLSVTTPGGHVWNNLPPRKQRTTPKVGRIEKSKRSYLRRIEITKPQLFLGHISQRCSGLTHHVSPERLRIISASIPKVLILTGDEDNLVNPANSFRLKASMPEAELAQWEETGHGITNQRARRFNEALEKHGRRERGGSRRIRRGNIGPLCLVIQLRHVLRSRIPTYTFHSTRYTFHATEDNVPAVYVNRRANRLLAGVELVDAVSEAVPEIVAEWLRYPQDMNHKLSWFVSALQDSLGAEILTADYTWKMIRYFKSTYVVSGSRPHGTAASAEFREEISRHPISIDSTSKRRLYQQDQALLRGDLDPTDVDVEGRAGPCWAGSST
ncbi:hypothetical protein D9611_007611 [Ephemerocybe angulata]|uniref:AB hydrolase-1 domain-containing protein n=1 Tax=Ephemerocybe angulata TaxID=980116 RepID=A0A8H5C0C1_9AGAR|nr:hypothetical protein D9611_007611 [Tulosesus angulatus]